jgi:hypothetical protein
MQENTSHKRRRWQRQPSNIPISLALEDDLLKADDSAITVDISPRGPRVRTKLKLVLGDWVKVSAKGEFTYAITALVVWVRMGESDHSTVAGLELF